MTIELKERHEEEIKKIRKTYDDQIKALKDSIQGETKMIELI
jgi:hypothetical protein